MFYSLPEVAEYLGLELDTVVAYTRVLLRQEDFFSKRNRRFLRSPYEEELEQGRILERISPPPPFRIIYKPGHALFIRFRDDAERAIREKKPEELFVIHEALADYANPALKAEINKPTQTESSPPALTYQIVQDAIEKEEAPRGAKAALKYILRKHREGETAVSKRSVLEHLGRGKSRFTDAIPKDLRDKYLRDVDDKQMFTSFRHLPTSN